MTYNISKAAVLGSGVMGAAIAGHLAGVGIPVLLLDIVPKELNGEEKAKGLSLEDWKVRNRISLSGKERAANPKNMAMYDSGDAELISVGNFEDDLEKISDVDWIVEAIVENLEIKKTLYQRLVPYLKNQTIISSNTSGISINRMGESLPLENRKHFLGTHFFNPPRFMKLLEIVPCEDTEPELVSFMAQFSEVKLGKGVVIARDTPNFIANRIGTYNIQVIIDAMDQYGISIPEVDAVTGSVMGKPKSATFKTMDIVGLDTYCHVVDTVYQNVDDIKEKEQFKVKQAILEMVEKGMLGDKAGKGFYKKVKGEKGKETYYLNLASMEYLPVMKLSIPALDEAGKGKSFQERIKCLVNGEDRINRFAWTIIKKTLLYTADKAPDISSDIQDIDKAMKWGFNWEIGPFALWDTLGLQETVSRMQEEGEFIPSWVLELKERGAAGFYEGLDKKAKSFITLSDKKNNLIRFNSEAALVDLGDDIACLQFRSKNNSLTEGVVNFINEALTEVRMNYRGLVIANQGKNFSVGANLYLIMEQIEKKDWDNLERLVKSFQDGNMALKYFIKPVVSAPYGMTLGGGAEICLHSHSLTPHAETYMGLVEMGVGLLPGAGGTKESLLRAVENIEEVPDADTLPLVRKALENIIMAKVSKSAKDAVKLGYIKKGHKIIVNSDYLVTEAKKECLRLSESFRPMPGKEVVITGSSGLASIKYVLFAMKSGGMISTHDETIAAKIAWVMTGGNLPSGSKVTEQYILDLEREAFLSLAGEEKTLERIKHMLATGKPLRN